MAADEKSAKFTQLSHRCSTTIRSTVVNRLHSESQTATTWLDEKSGGHQSRFDSSSGQRERLYEISRQSIS